MIDLHPENTKAYTDTILCFKYSLFVASVLIIAVIAWNLWQAHRRATERIKQLTKQAETDSEAMATEMDSIKRARCLRYVGENEDGHGWVLDEVGEAA